MLPGRAHRHVFSQEARTCVAAGAVPVRQDRCGGHRNSGMGTEHHRSTHVRKWAHAVVHRVSAPSLRRAQISTRSCHRRERPDTCHGRGALRVGAGLASVASPPDAIAVNAAQLTAIMVKPFDGPKGLSALLADKRFNAAAIGPGSGVGARTQDLVAAVLASGAAAVLDADALTSFAEDPNALFRQLRQSCVLTPHEGEFERVFPQLLNELPSKLAAAREVARLAGCVLLLKGPDTIIAGPDGRAAINANAPPWLATAGAGDVLTGMIAGLMAQGMNPFEAASAAAWLHGEAATRFGPGLIAEDIAEQLPGVLKAMMTD